MTISGGELFIDLLQSYGVDHIFCSPGSEWAPVWEGLFRRYHQEEKAPKYINCRHEMIAVPMAMGHTIATGRLSAVILHSSVGPLHAAMAIRSAYVGRIPMIICGGIHSDHEVMAPGGHWLGQLSDMGGPAAMVAPYVKWSNTVTSREAMLDSVYRGCQIASAVPQGPVFLAISGELLNENLAEIDRSRLSPPVVLPGACPDNLGEVARRLIESELPVIITEHAGRKLEEVDRLRELAELLGAPVFECGYPSFTSFPRSHPMYMGDDVNKALDKADTVLVVRSSVPWYPPSALPKNGATIIVMDEAPSHEIIPYWGYHADLILPGDIGLGLAALVNIIRTGTGGKGRPAQLYRARFEQWQQEHERMVEKWQREAVDGCKSKPISPRWLMHAASQVLPGDSIIIDETITHGRSVRRFLAEPGRYLRPQGGGLGSGMGAAAGIKLAHPDKTAVLILGDGAFNYNPVLAGLGVYQQYRLPVLTIILNDGGYQAMKMAHKTLYPEGWAACNNSYLGAEIQPGPDYAKAASVFGDYGERVEEPGEIEPAINRALREMEKGRATLLDFIVGAGV